jgi:cytochrome c oxidase assembly protein subunit 15
MKMDPNQLTGSALRRFTKFVAASTLFLIFAGAMVTSTGSGLAVPDWPLSYGMLMPPMVGGIFYEHGHRMIAATVGFLTLIQAFWLHFREPKRFVRILGWVALAAVIAQGLLGGMTVLFLLPPAISIAHAGLAEIFLCLTVSIAFFTSRSYAALAGSASASDQSVTAKVLVGVTYTQVLLGALMRHLGAGLAIPDFPLSFGRIVPDFTTVEITSAYSHRVGAVAVLFIAVFAAVGAYRSRSRALALVFTFLLAVLALQITLGATTVWMKKQPNITSVHVMTGALMLATTVVYALTAARVRPQREPVSAHELREVTA